MCSATCWTWPTVSRWIWKKRSAQKNGQTSPGHGNDRLSSARGYPVDVISLLQRAGAGPIRSERHRLAGRPLHGANHMVEVIGLPDQFVPFRTPAQVLRGLLRVRGCNDPRAAVIGLL